MRLSTNSDSLMTRRSRTDPHVVHADVKFRRHTYTLCFLAAQPRPHAEGPAAPSGRWNSDTAFLHSFDSVYYARPSVVHCAEQCTTDEHR